MGKPYSIAVFASGSGSNAESIFRYFKDHETIEVALLLSNNANAFAIERAKNFGIKTKIFNREQFTSGNEILSWLTEERITHIVLAGFLWLIPAYLTSRFHNKIVNIHPSLLPKFGGKGMYGLKVHEAVRSAKENETGITIHLVNEKYDEGEVLFQGVCSINENMSAREISECVLQLEHKHYPEVIEKWILT